MTPIATQEHDIETQAILEHFDRERRELVEAGMRREATPNVVRNISIEGTDSWITYSHHTPNDIDAAIEAEIAYFESIGHPFEWKVFDHDQPSNLRERLVAHGFEEEEAEAFMVLDLDAAPAGLLAPVTHDIRRVTAPEDVQDYRRVSEQAWGYEGAGHIARITEQLRDIPDEIGVYVAFVDGVPASCGRASYPNGSAFAGMWAGATVPAYRKQGLYQALVATRVQEARARGYRYLTIDALPTSRPIVERLGFELATFTHPLRWYKSARNATDV